jgi:ubiquinone/menaquinone biosynthesis C-methylase UbiE
VLSGVNLLRPFNLAQTPRRHALDRFDRQAERFDRRAGLAQGVAREVASALVRTLSLRASDVVLEIGAGTGAIGCELLELAPQYVGLDLSRQMLDVFRRKLTCRKRGVLVLGDANRLWPVRDATVAVVFASRAAHLLNGPHLIDEVRRVCRAGGYLLIGRIEREPNSLRSRLRQERLRLRSSMDSTRQQHGQGLLERAIDRGGTRVAKRTVATWSGVTTAERIISEWEHMQSDVREMPELREWALRQLGGLHHAEPYTERYTFEGVQIGLQTSKKAPSAGVA